MNAKDIITWVESQVVDISNERPLKERLYHVDLMLTHLR
jgi:hypothetical protein